jgi:hypothetical protein
MYCERTQERSGLVNECNRDSSTMDQRCPVTVADRGNECNADLWPIFYGEY